MNKHNNYSDVNSSGDEIKISLVLSCFHSSFHIKYYLFMMWADNDKH